MGTDLLPVNATKQERALALATARVGSVPVPVGELWDPATCPADLLPWLSYALHVDTWDNGWTEAQKRAIIANSYQTHRVKGSVGAVRRMANSFGTTIVIRDWFQQDPPGDPYTFTATFSVPDCPPEQKATIIAAIESVKPVRSVMYSDVVDNVTGSLGVFPIVRVATFIRFDASLN